MSKKENHRGRVVLFWFTLIFLLVGISYLAKRIVGIRKSPFVRLEKINLLVLGAGEKIFLISFCKTEADVIDIPFGRKVFLITSPGEEGSKSDFEISKEDIKEPSFLKGNLQSILSVPIFGYIRDPNFRPISKEGKALSRVFWQSLQKKGQTSFNKDDLLLIWFKSYFGIKDVKFKELDSDYKAIFKDPRIREEALSIEVLNATDHDGLAQKASFLLENIGARVIRLADSAQKTKSCQIFFGSRSENSYTLEVLKLSYNCRVKRGDGEDKDSRADISLLLGEDYWEKTLQKW